MQVVGLFKEWLHHSPGQLALIAEPVLLGRPEQWQHVKERFDVMLWNVLTVSRVLTRARSVAISPKVINALVAL